MESGGFYYDEGRFRGNLFQLSTMLSHGIPRWPPIKVDQVCRAHGIGVNNSDVLLQFNGTNFVDPSGLILGDIEFYPLCTLASNEVYVAYGAYGYDFPLPP